MIDDRSLQYFQENEQMDYFNLTSSGNNDDFRSNNFNEMVSNFVDEYQSYEMLPKTTWSNNELIDYTQQMKGASERNSHFSNPSQQLKFNFSLLSESGHPRNIPDTCSSHSNPPKDIQVLIRQVDHTGINSLIKNISLQQFRQMIGLQRSSGLPTINDRKSRYHSSNIRLINVFKQQKSSIDTNLSSSQEISYFRSNRRTGLSNTLHIAIEKCYEQLNYIRDSYTETESKIGIQILLKPSLMFDLMNTNLSNNPSRVDRLIVEYYYEYNRIIHLHGRIQEDFNNPDIEATRQTLDEWFNAINIVQDRRREEINNATEKDVLQLAESLRILRITTRKIRTVLWYWLYWSTNSLKNETYLKKINTMNDLFS